jgi:hypothetical protein
MRVVHPCQVGPTIRDVLCKMRSHPGSSTYVGNTFFRGHNIRDIDQRAKGYA